MYSRALFLIPFLAGFVPIASACEGECIVGITKAFLGNYSAPIHSVFKELSEQVSTQLLPPSQRPADPTTFMQPIFAAYSNSSYNLLETAIFPSYFHGKCQRFSKDGQDPPGCPNPDCPVVCGTPGSLVHFYSTLRYIAYNSTKTALEKLTTPGNPAYDQVDALVKKAQKAQMHEEQKRGSVTVSNNSASYKGMISHSHVSHEHNKHAHSRHFGSVGGKRGTVSLQARSSPTLASILAQFDTMFDKECGGNARDSNDGLPKCSWEDDMKQFILTFP